MSVPEIHCDQLSVADVSVTVAASTPATPAEHSLCDETGPSASAGQNAAQRCFSDGLHSIFAFLNLPEFVAASLCCRGWSAAGATQPPFRLSRDFTTNALKSIIHSHVARHIDQLHLSCFSREIPSAVSLCCRLPHLTHLTLDVSDDPDLLDVDPDWAWFGLDEDQTPIQMPTALRKLEVRLRSHHIRRLEWSLIDTLLARICHADTPPLTSLQLGLNGDGAAVTLTAQIPAETLSRILVLKESLIEFGLRCRHMLFESELGRESMHQPARWIQEHIDVFRQLTRLEKLDPFDRRWSDEELIMLCAEPAPKHLRILPLNAPPTTAAGAEALARLRLTEIYFREHGGGAADDFIFLSRIPTLEVIDMRHIPRPASSTDKDALADILAGCTQCTELTMPMWMTNAHLCRSLPAMTKLRVLTTDTSWFSRFHFGGLSFASSSPHLARTLERLDLNIPQPMSLTELDHLYALTNLRHLQAWLIIGDGTRSDLCQATLDCDSERPRTFRRDMWPHMVESSVILDRPNDYDY